MRSTRRFGKLCAPMALVVALLLPLSVAGAVPSWGPDYDISDGDINDTFTSNNGQRFIALDDSNNMFVAFYDNRFKTQFHPSDNNFEIFFRYFKYNFGSPYITRVTNAHNPSRYPAIAIRNWGDGDFGTQQDSGRVYIVWQDSRLFSVPLAGEPKSYTIFMRTFRTKGGTGFGPERQVSPYDSVNAATSPVVTVGDSGRVWIAWQKPANGANTTDVYYSVYHSNTGLLDPVLPLSASTRFAGNPTIAAGRDGVVHAAWVDTRTGSQQIWTRRFVPGTGWTAEEQIVFSTGATASASAPSIVADYNNHMHLVWVDLRNGNNEIYYKEYVPGVGWDALDTRVTVSSFGQIQPSADADPMGNVYLVWTDYRNGSGNPDIYYDSRLEGVWQGNTSLVGAASDTTDSAQLSAGIAHDDFGTAFVAWTDYRMPGNNKDAFYKVGAQAATAVPVSETPALGRLLRNYPNPFNPRTRIQFALDRDAQVTMRVFDVHGRAVRTLIDSYLAAGPRVVDWDGKDERGKVLPSGAYFLRLEGGGKYMSRTINLVK